MNILIVSATQFEVKPLVEWLEIEPAATGLYHSPKVINGVTADVLITGIGMVNTAYHMGKHSGNTYDLVLNVGVCGSFDKSMVLGDIVNITTDVLSELGAEDGDVFLTYDAMNLPGEHVFTSQLQDGFGNIQALRQVKGITVNTVHGNEDSIDAVKQLYAPDVESMEGAAFYASCKGVYANYTQIRAVSNYVEKRDKSKWQMPLAIKNLNNFLMELMHNF